VAEDQRAPRADVVDEFAAIGVDYARTASAVDDERFPTDSAKCADGAIDATNKNFLRARRDPKSESRWNHSMNGGK